MTDENETPQVDETETAAPAPAIKADIPRGDCDRCDCTDCPGVGADTTAELAQHSKACPEKHF